MRRVKEDMDSGSDAEGKVQLHLIYSRALFEPLILIHQLLSTI